MKKIISFSLWGDNPKYTIGAIENIKIAQKIYPDWICRFYVASSTPKNIIDELSSYANGEIITMTDDGNWTSMFWRFFACEDSDIMISRDTDSRLSIREKLAVDEWISSEKNFHIMRDHPYHSVPILGGMWGSKQKILKNIKELVSNYNVGNFWQIDQNFLKDIIYPKIKNDCFVHDEFFNFEKEKKSFPTKRINKEFVGDVFDEKNNRHPNYYKLL